MPAKYPFHIRVRGIVQGVGFRPFVYRLARELELEGWVRNDGAGVEMAVRAHRAVLAALLARMKSEAPPLAHVECIEVEDAPDGFVTPPGFRILESGGGSAQTEVTPDAATCPDCLAELLDPANRRYRYPFINCTHCGPRYTITAQLPYDRPKTSMAGFTLCPACRAEYDDPLDRRFHAQPNACPACGPTLELIPRTGEDPIAAAVALLRAGRILAVKGLGGFHLMCDARKAATVAELRRRKQREAKPFAVMAANPASLAPLAHCTPEEENLLQTRERPIVLLAKRAVCDAALPGVAEGVAGLGALLPYAPLHTLLFHEAAGRPAGTDWLTQPQELLLVCTSANPGGEPLVTGNDEALARLSGIADAFLLHNRDILIGCDDSLAACDDRAISNNIPIGEQETPPHYHFIRRARGYTPRAIRLPRAGPSVLACGGWLKNTVCLTRDNQAFVSQHIGDLDNAAACGAMEAAAAHLQKVLEIRPRIIACDRHPDYYSSRFAAALAGEQGLPLVAVQHHHAHLAAVLAENGITRPALGLALDGTGLGDDGRPWGGELMLLQGADCTRLGHLAELPLPGGDRAAREPWRMAASALHALGRGAEIERRFASIPAAATVADMLARNVNAPPASSGGRLFDAAAGLLGLLPVTAFEGQAAMLLESLAGRHGTVAPLTDGYRLEANGTLNFLPLLATLADETDAARGAALFHATLARGLAKWVAHAAHIHGLDSVALSGGCFLNANLSHALRALLRQKGLNVLEHRQVPPNDGGISLGQAWVALQTKH